MSSRPLKDILGHAENVLVAKEKTSSFFHFEYITTDTVPHSKSGLVPRSSLSGAGQLGFWETGEGGAMGEGWSK